LKTSAQAAAEAFPPETKHRANMKRYAVYGALFGVVFPLIALCFRWAENGFEQALASLNLDPLFWIICTAPLFLGLFAALAGVKQDAAERAIVELEYARAATERRVQEAVAIIRKQEAEARAKEIEADALRRKADAEAARAQKVQYEFLANISHELRTPITSILGFIDILREESSTPENEHFFRLALRSGQALLVIINDLIDFADLEARRVEIAMETTNIPALVRDMAEVFLAAAHQKNIRIETILSADVPSVVLTDPRRVRQILYNLIGNAVKFTDKGEVRVEVERATASAAEQTISLRFTVRDTGVGITEEFQKRVFEEFRQQDGSAQRRYGGLGLGLALVKNAVEMLGGDIYVESRVGEGSAFTVLIPCHLAESVSFCRDCGEE
jgi:signal transduction histidine kinase